jgi:hypothetical protein
MLKHRIPNICIKDANTCLLLPIMGIHNFLDYGYGYFWDIIAKWGGATEY